MSRLNAFFTVLLIFVIIFTSGCGKTPPPTTLPLPTESATPSSQPTPTITLTPTQIPEGETIIVRSTEDEGPGTLRQALMDAEAWDTILFDPAVFLPDAPATIAISSGLPQITQGHLTIDGSDAGVILDGSQLPADSWTPGLEFVSSGNTVRGLHVINFTGTGIVVAGNNENNVIGGDPAIGSGPLGEGNLTSGNDFGIGLWNFAANNTITGNIVGTEMDGAQATGNRSSGIWLSEGAQSNIVGPGNVVTHSGRCGIEIGGADTDGNTLTQNSVYANAVAGICVGGGANASLGAPFIGSFELPAGYISGTACANCTVEVFSDDENQGVAYEGRALADSDGVFVFEKGSAFINTNVTTTATDSAGNTSAFSLPVSSASAPLSLQAGNEQPPYRTLALPSGELDPDARLGWELYSSNIWEDIPNLAFILGDYTNIGIKRLDTSMQEVEEPIDWSQPEFTVFPEYDQLIDSLNENGIVVNYMLHFWDKDGHPNGEGLETPRFKTEEQIQDFLDYVRFVVDHFKGRVQYYTIWSEPDACGGSNIKCIEPADYIELARQTIPVIHEVDPDAKVALAPNVLYFAQDYLFEILESDVISMFDAIQWHGRYDALPDSGFYGDYYYEYPAIVETIQQTAAAHGFQGEYWATEITWCSEEFPTCHPPDQPWKMAETDKIAAKYDARSFIMHLGWDMGVGWGGIETNAQPWTYPTIRNLNTLMNGTEPADLSPEIESEATNLVNYSFTLPDGDQLFALWEHGVAASDDPGTNATLTFSGLSADKVVGIDVLYGFEQSLITETDEDGNLVVRNLLVKDYPIIIRFVDPASP